MGGIKKLRKVQFGLEVTPGSAVAASVLWRGLGMLDDQREITFVDESIGVLAGTDRTYTARVKAQCDLAETPLTFEQLPLLLCIAIDDLTSGVADGSGTDFIYTYTGGQTSQPGYKTFTVETGDNQQAEKCAHMFASEIALKGASGEAWMMSGTLIGAEVENTTFTPALSVPAVETALFNKTKLYIDDGGGTIGTTQKSNTLLDCEITIRSGLMPKETADGELYFSFVNQGAPDATMNVTFEHDGTATAEKTAWRDETTRLIRLLVEGSQFSTPGTEYTYHTLQIDMAGKWEKFDPIDDVDGNDICKGTFQSRYSSADALSLEIVVANELSDIIS